MSRIDTFCDRVGADLAARLGPDWGPVPGRNQSIGTATAFGTQGVNIRPSVKGLPHSYVTFRFGVQHDALDTLRERAGLRVRRGFDASCDSDSAATMRGRPGKPGLRRIRSRVECGPFACNLDTDAPGMAERVWPFFTAVVLPYFEHFADLRNIRRSIERDDGWCRGLAEVEVAMLIYVHLKEGTALPRFRKGRPPPDQRRFDQLLEELQPLL